VSTPKQQTQSAQQAQIRGITGTGLKVTTASMISKSTDAQAYTSADMFSTLIRLGSNLGMGIYSFLSAKKEQKKQVKVAASKKSSRDAITATLENIYQYGISLIEQTDISPLDPAFDKLLTDQISAMTGYQGKCEGDIFGPETKTVWFKVRAGKVVPEPGVTIPDNADALWSLGCKNLQSRWVIAYQQKLVSQKRTGELEQLRSSFSKSNLGMGLGFGTVTGIVVIILIFNILKMVKQKRAKKSIAKKRKHARN